MEDNKLESYKNWDIVEDYESDELVVTLLDKNSTPLAEFNYPKFTAMEFNYFKNNS